MSSKRSYLENVNAGRQRRSGATLDEINRTLQQLESRLGQATDRGGYHFDEAEEEFSSRMQRLSDRVGFRRPQPTEQPVSARRSKANKRAALERIAHEIDTSRRRDSELASISGIATELKAMREDMRNVMGSGLQREFNTLRDELGRLTTQIPQSRATDELNAEFERLSHLITSLSERTDDKSVKLLRLELEQVKSALANLAREETVRALDKRWDAFENRLSGFQRASDPAIERLGARLDDISTAVNNLPESLSLRSLEERVRALAGALDQFAGQHDRNRPDLYVMVEERLDEISRAITASAALANSPSFDSKLLERIEARINSLATQLDEVVQDRPGGVIVERLNTLSERVDEVARRIEVPEQVVERLASHISRISEKLDTAPQGADHLFHSIEDRFAHLSELIERRQEDAIQHGHALFADLERRIEDLANRLDRAGSSEGAGSILTAIESRIAELALRLDERSEPSDNAMLRSLEARLEDISGRLQSTASAAPGVNPDLIRNLEAQVADLAAHLRRPDNEPAELEELAPRLDNIERSISESRTALLAAARQAAEEAIEKLGADPADERLNEEIRTLHGLMRKSDERNTKTFEAIHDTLLKIVDRLSTVESGGERTIGNAALGQLPPVDLAAADAPETHDEPAPRRTPAEAAAAAAEAALMEDTEEEARPKRALGLAKAFTGRRARAEAARKEPVFTPREAADAEPALDDRQMNEPLEPGSGAPDLNAILRRVRDEREAPTEETARADFIAAARRAAQAAAAEAESLKNHRVDANEKSSKSTLGRILGRHKRKLMLTLAATIMLAAGLHFVSSLPQGNAPERIAQEPAPAGQEQAAAESAPPASLAGDDQTRPVRVVDNEESRAGAAPTSPDEPSAEELLFASETGPANGTLMPSQLATAALPEGTGIQDEPEELEVLTEFDLPEIPARVGSTALREAAERGDPKALYEIGSRYAEGRGMAVDLASAAQWYEVAAEHGLAPAQYRIGNLYEKGNGVERDISKAKLWYQLAAEQGNASAMHNLGVLYAMGADGPADNETAARWFQKAAELGVSDSQFNLGILSAKGVGVPRDLGEAYKWFDVVARSGDADAAAKRDEVAKAMAPADLAKAQSATKLWKPREPNPEANIVDIPDEWQVDLTVTGTVDTRKALTNIQLILNKIGFDAGAPDGIMGEKTRAAIRAFQKQSGMQETGEIDEALVRALLARNETAQ